MSKITRKDTLAFAKTLGITNPGQYKGILLLAVVKDTLRCNGIRVEKAVRNLKKKGVEKKTAAIFLSRSLKEVILTKKQKTYMTNVFLNLYNPKKTPSKI